MNDFYVPCLEVSLTYDRAVGYFRSSLLAATALAYSQFVRRGGRTRMLCSPSLSTEDVEAINKGEALVGRIEGSLSAELNMILCHPQNHPVAAFLATLIGLKALEMRVALRPSPATLFHDKIGVFKDSESNSISFIGSTNETFSAWSLQGNHESFEVFRSWVSDSEAERVERHSRLFDSMWEGRDTGVQVLGFPEAFNRKLLLLSDDEGIDAAAEKVRRNAVDGVEPQGRNITLQEHQRSAIISWQQNGSRGIVAHATGSGKTVTALEIVKQWTLSLGPAMVLVPGDLLARQWQGEVSSYIPSANILIAGAGFGPAKWQPLLSDFTRPSPHLGQRVTVATIQTASTADFRGRVVVGEHLLVVADEVHRVGSGQFRRVLELEAGGRLGLSATPERYGDPEGTRLILDYFGGILPPPFGITDAIKSGRLVPYDYYIHPVALSDSEQESWDELTEKIGVEYAKLRDGSGSEDGLPEKLKFLLIQRARILKNATGKTALARDVLVTSFQSGSFWLVYCDNQDQLGNVLRSLRKAGLEASEYHSSMLGARGETLDHFRDHGGILVAIKCLDEGIDIPLVDHALILASSSNEREFIQRRGRALRSAPAKYSATIHDAVVVPADEARGSGSDRGGIMRRELARAREFAKSARNLAVMHEIELLSEKFGPAIGSRTDDYEEE